MKKINVARTGILYLSCILLFSCGKSIPSNQQYRDSAVSKSFAEIFDKFWNGVNKNYVFWDMDTTNWDAIYTLYKPLFSKLDINNEADQQTSISYFKAMTLGLIDGHFQIIFSKPSLQNVNIYPAFIRKQGRPGFRLPFDYSNIDTQYFDTGYMTGYDSVTKPGSSSLHITLATINKRILYFSCNKFSLSVAYNSPIQNGAKLLLDSFFAVLNSKDTAIKGLIIDMRNNFGGDLSDLNFLVGHFIDKPLRFGYSRYKSGAGRLDHTPWIEAYITPQPNGTAVKYTIVVLTDNFTVSLAEMVAMAVGALSNGTIVGETTWGATGALVANEVYNDGQFTVPGFMTVYASSIEFKYIDNKIYEDTGFPPDILVPFNAQAVASGKDTQIEKAIQLIN